MKTERAVAEKKRIKTEKTMIQAEKREIKNKKENIMAARAREVAEIRRLTGVLTEDERKRFQAENQTSRLAAELEDSKNDFENANEQLTIALNRCTTLATEREWLGADALEKSQEINNLQAKIDEQTRDTRRLQARITWLGDKVVDLQGRVG
jgi:chromosome segregation ATPase